MGEINVNILILQHSRKDTAGLLQQFLDEDGHRYDILCVDETTEFPSLDKYNALWVMGGAANAWQEEDYPFLMAEKELIKTAVKDKGLAYLGICLGHQLLADALGGKVEPSEHPEIGLCRVQQTEMGATGIFLDDFPDEFDVVQWHASEVKTMPAGAQCLATSPDCAVQAMRWGNRAYSTQFHFEIGQEEMAFWMSLPSMQTAFEGAGGAEGQQRFLSAFNGNETTLKQQAERLYMNWLQIAARS